MAKRYARELRRSVCERLVTGEKVSSLSKELGVSEATPYLWKRQALIDAGRAEGVESFEADELTQAHKTTAELEVELEAVKAARAPFNGEEPVSPKGVPGCRGPSDLGYSERVAVGPSGYRVRASRAQISRDVCPFGHLALVCPSGRGVGR